MQDNLTDTLNNIINNSESKQLMIKIAESIKENTQKVNNQNTLSVNKHAELLTLLKEILPPQKSKKIELIIKIFEVFDLANFIKNETDS